MKYADAPASEPLNIKNTLGAVRKLLRDLRTRLRRCSFLQMMPGVLVVLASGDERFLTSRSGQAPAPAPVASSTGAATPQGIQALLSSADIASLPTVPQGLQIILLPPNAVIPGLPASSPIPASFQVPAALSSYNYILTSSGAQLPTLPAGLSSITPTQGSQSFLCTYEHTFQVTTIVAPMYCMTSQALWRVSVVDNQRCNASMLALSNSMLAAILTGYGIHGRPCKA